MIGYYNIKMDPQISIGSDAQYLRFQLSGVNVSIANSIRRTIISEIPCVVFRTSPHEENRVKFEINTTRLNNELIKQRVSCIPIHITDTTFPHDDYVIGLDVVNESDQISYATTEDFTMKNVKTNTYSDASTIFPPDPFTKNHIDIVRLRPGEQIKFTAKLDIGMAKQDGAFNVASTCSYAYTQNVEASETAWKEKRKTLEGSEEEIEKSHQDWMLLDAKRYTFPDSFDFVIESVGQFTNQDLVYKACDVIVKKLKRLEDNLQTKANIINKSSSTIKNSFDVILDGEDHTLGKALEYALYSKHYEGDKSVTFCGFRKPHPHIDTSVIRIAFSTEKETFDVITVVVNAIKDLLRVYEAIGIKFKDN